MRYLFDTCVISELISKKPNTKVLDWIQNQDEENIYISSLTIGEIQQGIEKLPQSKKRNLLRNWLSQDLLIRFNKRIFNIDTDVMITWGTMMSSLEKKGTPMPIVDSLIVATALTHKLIIVTRNTKDFINTVASLLNPWDI